MEDLSRRPAGPAVIISSKSLRAGVLHSQNAQECFKFQPQAMHSLFSDCHVGNVASLHEQQSSQFSLNLIIQILFFAPFSWTETEHWGYFQLIGVWTRISFLNQSNNFKHSYKRSDWFKLACFIAVLTTPQISFRSWRLENKVEFLKKMTCSLS